MRRILGFAILTVFLLAAGWAILRSSKPRPGCFVAVHVVGITNDGWGTRQATLLVSNAGGQAVFLTPAFGLENRSGQWRTNLIPAKAMVLNTNLMGVLPFHPRSKKLGTAESYEVKLPLPFDDSGWRACFWYIEDRSGLTGLLDDLSTALRMKKPQTGQPIAFTDWTDR